MNLYNNLDFLNTHFNVVGRYGFFFEIHLLVNTAKS